MHDFRFIYPPYEQLIDFLLANEYDEYICK